MAKTLNLVMALIFVFNILILNYYIGNTSLDWLDTGRPNLLNVDVKKPDDIKHPEKFFFHDRGYLIPCLGRGIKPKSKKGFNPFTYNPITGSNNGFPGVSVPSFGGQSGGRNYVPGGDDTLVPNPGVEVPAGGIGNTPVPTNP
ncbi:putative cell wall protein [Bidens hawaiensis]|uniref:putative cell wall protein n=1 Tax=Bidens hawaiensis TaxID=980011 RepID=UPI00404A0F2E